MRGRASSIRKSHLVVFQVGHVIRHVTPGLPRATARAACYALAPAGASSSCFRFPRPDLTWAVWHARVCCLLLGGGGHVHGAMAEEVRVRAGKLIFQGCVPSCGRDVGRGRGARAGSRPQRAGRASSCNPSTRHACNRYLGHMAHTVQPARKKNY